MKASFCLCSCLSLPESGRVHIFKITAFSNKHDTAYILGTCVTNIGKVHQIRTNYAKKLFS